MDLEVSAKESPNDIIALIDKIYQNQPNVVEKSQNLMNILKKWV